MRRKTRTSDLDDEMRSEYDLSQLKLVGRGIYAGRYRAGVKFFLLDNEPGVSEHNLKEDNLNESGNISDPTKW
jgi:hypothetical protein